MATTIENPLIGTPAEPSPAGPLDAPDPGLRTPPELPLSPALQSLRFLMRPHEFMHWARRTAGDVFTLRLTRAPGPVVSTCHPDHIKSIFTHPDITPSLTGESPLKPIIGPNTVLTAVGERHMRQRKLLLPRFHGKAVDRFVEIVEDSIRREVDSWQPGQKIEMASRMSAVTLDVIMTGMFGIDGRHTGGPEARLRRVMRRVMDISTRKWWPLVEASSIGYDHPRVPLSFFANPLYRALEDLIVARRAVPEDRRGDDLLSLLLSATDEDGVPLTDLELRNELLTLVLAGHETTANAMAWITERLVRNPEPYDRIRDEVRSGGGEDYIQWVIQEGLRVRPVIPIVVRTVKKPWRFGDYGIPDGYAIACNIIQVHHREDIYPDPFSFRPERWEGVKPSTYSWIPFGGSIRRCLGATLAQAELRVMLREVMGRIDLAALDLKPERARLRNVTLIPDRGGEVMVVRRD